MTKTEITAVEKKNVADFQYYAQTMHKQMQYPNKMIFFSWGAHNFQLAQTKEEYPKPCLRFKVNGMKFKGYVHILYNWADYYEIEFISTHGNIKHEVREVYFDQLQEVIDNYTEKIEEYAF